MDTKKELNVQIVWPDLEFPPVNLNVLVDAWFFYSTPKEREEYFRKIFYGE